MVTKIILHPGKEISVKRRHPWIFSGAIARIEGVADEGALAEVYSHKGDYCATGHYHKGSIAVRIFSFNQTAISDDFWNNKIKDACALRAAIGLTSSKETNAYRLVYAEGDMLPGLIIDYYNGTAVIQTHAPGMHKLKQLLIKALISIYGDNLKAVYDKGAEIISENQKNELSVSRDEACLVSTYRNGYLWGSPLTNEIMENGKRFFVDWETGQKTGFFLDQRDNRALLEKHVYGKTVLDACCYTGGFSVYAASGGAKEIHSVDSSQKALQVTERNMSINSTGKVKHELIEKDIKNYFRESSFRYDVIILDPPAFAKRINVRHNALMAYKRLNADAFKNLEKNGMLFTFCCSQVVSRQMFRDTVMAAAAEAMRDVKILYHLSQPPDHPVNLGHPEGEYLKGLVLLVQ